MAKKTSVAQKASYTRYKNDMSWKENRVAKLEKHLELHPDDAIATQALKTAKAATAPRRAGYKSAHPNRTSGRLVAQLKRMIKGAVKAELYEQKKEAEAKIGEVKKSRKPRHKAAKAA